MRVSPTRDLKFRIWLQGQTAQVAAIRVEHAESMLCRLRVLADEGDSRAVRTPVRLPVRVVTLREVAHAVCERIVNREIVVAVLTPARRDEGEAAVVGRPGRL